MSKRVRWKAKQLRLALAAELGRDVTQEEVSNSTGIAVSTLSAIENNRAKGVEFETLVKLANFYRVKEVGDLLVFEDQIRASRSSQALQPA